MLQSLLEHNPYFYHDALLTFVAANALDMCLSKFSSFVIEKVAKHTHRNIKRVIYDQVFNINLKDRQGYKSSVLFKMLYNE